MEWFYPLPNYSHLISIHKTWNSSFLLGTSLSEDFSRIYSSSHALSFLSSRSIFLPASCSSPSGWLTGTHFPHPTSNPLLPSGLLNSENATATHIVILSWGLEIFPYCPCFIRYQVPENLWNIPQMYIFYYITNGFVLLRSSFPFKNNILNDSE